MDRYLLAEQAYIVAAAAAHDLNDELTVILSSVMSSIDTLEDGHPARPHLLELRRSAQRCAWKMSGLLNYACRRHGAYPVAAPLETLLDN